MESRISIKTEEKALLFKIRGLVVFYMFALFFWGVTAFPVETEMRIICKILGVSLDTSPETYDGLLGWVAIVSNALIDTNKNYPFLAYGTDWLAFSHLVIAAAFIGLYRKPVRNIWIVHFAMIACIGVVPLAMVCGAVRDIPFGWRLIDSSFCIFGLIPLFFLHVYINRLGRLIGYIPAKY